MYTTKTKKKKITFYLIGSFAVSFDKIGAYFGCFINFFVQIRTIILWAHNFQEESANWHLCEAHIVWQRTSVKCTATRQEPVVYKYRLVEHICVYASETLTLDRSQPALDRANDYNDHDRVPDICPPSGISDMVRYSWRAFDGARVCCAFWQRSNGPGSCDDRCGRKCYFR